MSELDHIISKCRDAAAGGIGVLSTGEALAAALVLNRPDWLAQRGYTIAEAIDRVGEEWLALVPAAAKQLQREEAERAEAAENARNASQVESLASAAAKSPDTSRGVPLTARLVTYGNAPGYRDANLVIDAVPQGAPEAQAVRLDLRFGPEDTETISRQLRDFHKTAWGIGAERPIDAREGEKRPGWLDRA